MTALLKRLVLHKCLKIMFQLLWNKSLSLVCTMKYLNVINVIIILLFSCLSF